MWIICCGMRRSASTLLYQITRRLVEDTGRGQGIGATEDGCLMAHPPTDQWQVLKTHERNERLAEALVNNQARGLYIYRNLYDVLVSASWNDPAVDLNNPDRVRERAAWLVDTYQFWTAQPNMLTLRYVDLTGRTPAAVKAIGHHLGLRVSDRWALHLAWTYSVPQQKARDHGADWRIADRIRDGRVGMWRDYVTDTQADLLHEIGQTAPEALRL